MIKKSIVLLFLISWTSLIGGDLKRIQKKYENQDWEKTEELILKSIDDQPINPGAKFYYSRLFLEPSFQSTSLDSARIFIFESLEDFEKSTPNILEELSDQDLRIEDLQAHFQVVSVLFFERAVELNTVQSLNAFLSYFPGFDRKEEVINLRDELVFNDLNNNLTIGSAKDFIEAYPASIFMEQVKNKLDSMLVLKHRKSQSVEALEKFIRENPKSEYLQNALGHLLPLRTLTGNEQDFQQFIEDYQRNSAATKAINFLFHLDAEHGFSDSQNYLDYHPKSDSLRDEILSKNDFYFPVFEKTFQLISPNGNSIETGLTHLEQNQICNGIESDVLAGRNGKQPGIVTRHGKTLFHANLIKDLGSGFLLIEESSIKAIVHKSGARIIQDIEDAELLGGSFFKVKNKKWGLRSLMGLEVTETRFDDISVAGNFWLFEKDGLFAIARRSELTFSFPEGLFLEFKFDDYELVNEDNLIGFRDDRECMLNSEGEFIVPWGIHQIITSTYQGYTKDKRGYAFFDSPEKFEYVETNEGFTLKKVGIAQWSLFANKEKWMLPLRDSLKLINDHCALLVNETPKLIFTNQLQLELDPEQQVSTLSNQYSYVLLKGGDVSTIVDSKGDKIFSGNFDQIRLLTDTLFSVSFRGKYGVISQSGIQILPLEFDFIGIENELITTLKDNRIGAFDLMHNILIEPNYESKIESFGSYYKTSLNGQFGLIDSLQKEVLPFEYEEVAFWTDSLVWAKSKDHFQLINLNNLNLEMEVSILSDFPTNKGAMIKFYDSSGFGLLSSEFGLILEPTFSEIRILGTPEKGVLIGEQALPQAGYRVLSYFDFKGNRIYSQAYRSEDYERLFCDN